MTQSNNISIMKLQISKKSRIWFIYSNGKVLLSNKCTVTFFQKKILYIIKIFHKCTSYELWSSNTITPICSDYNNNELRNRSSFNKWERIEKFQKEISIHLFVTCRTCSVLFVYQCQDAVNFRNTLTEWNSICRQYVIDS